MWPNPPRLRVWSNLRTKSLSEKSLCSGASKHLFIFLELMLEKADIDMDDIPEKLVKNERA